MRREEAQPRRNSARDRSEGDQPPECGKRRHNLGGTVHEIARRVISRRRVAREGGPTWKRGMASLGATREKGRLNPETEHGVAECDNGKGGPTWKRGKASLGATTEKEAQPENGTRSREVRRQEVQPEQRDIMAPRRTRRGKEANLKNKAMEKEKKTRRKSKNPRGFIRSRRKKKRNERARARHETAAAERPGPTAEEPQTARRSANDSERRSRSGECYGRSTPRCRKTRV